MILRRDHIAGLVFIAIGALVYAISGDLPFGSLASPGPGMLPLIAIGLMIVFALAVLAQAGESPPLPAISFADLHHALRVIVIAAIAIAAYQPAGFLLTIAAMLVVLVAVVERKPALRAVLFSIFVTIAVYLLFSVMLKAPLPRGLLGF